MKKIFIITIYDINKSGGLSTYVKNIQQLYLFQGFDSDIVTPFSLGRGGLMIFRFILLWTKVLYLINKNIGIQLYYRVLSFSIYKTLKRKKIGHNAILHFQDTVSLFYLNDIGEEKSKKILTLHGDLTNMNISDGILKEGSSGYKYSYSLESNAYKQADFIIAVDTRLKKHAIAMGVLDERIQNISNFTDVSSFSPISEEKKNKLRKKYNINTKAKVIFCPRRMVKKNGVIYTISILSELSDGYVLIITGVGPQKESIVEEIDRLGVGEQVIMTGDIPNEKISEYYTFSDLVIIPSINSDGVIEATSISAIESLACGIPVIASNIGGLTEIITNKYNGYLCEERNIGDFKKSIVKYFNLSEREKQLIRKNAYNSVMKDFSAESYYNKIKKYLGK